MDSRTVEGYNKLLIFRITEKLIYTIPLQQPMEVRVPFVGGAGGKILNAAFILKRALYREYFTLCAEWTFCMLRSVRKSIPRSEAAINYKGVLLCTICITYRTKIPTDTRM